jgi:hypothetical protein
MSCIGVGRGGNPRLLASVLAIRRNIDRLLLMIMNDATGKMFEVAGSAKISIL